MVTLFRGVQFPDKIRREMKVTVFTKTGYSAQMFNIEILVVRVLLYARLNQTMKANFLSA